jgi:hypothetical protein
MQSDFIDGGDINWANQSDGRDTQTQIGNLMQVGGLVGTSPTMMTSPLSQVNPMMMAKGGEVSEPTPDALIAKIREEFRKRGLDFDRYMAHRMAHTSK